MSYEKYSSQAMPARSSELWSNFDQSAEIGAWRGRADPIALLRTWQDLRADGFHLALEGQRLIVSPADRLSEAQDAFLRTHKADLVALFDAALAVLHTLHAQHVANLEAGGFDGKGALVNRRDYWTALNKAGIPTDTVFELLAQGRIRMQAEGLYWVPVTGIPVT